MALQRKIKLPSLSSLEEAAVAAYNCLYNGFTSPEPPPPPPELPPFAYEPKPYRGPVAGEILAKRAKYLGSSLLPYYDKPINIVEGKMQYLFDESGKRYLDAYTLSCGHCHPEILDAITEQRKLLQNAACIHLDHAIADFAEGLVSKMPGNLKIVYFVNSVAEAHELGMMMARLYSGNLRMIALGNAYQVGSVIGMGQNAVKTGLIAPNTWNYATPQGEIHHVLNPDPYRGVFGSDSSHYAKDVQDYIDHGASGKVAGFIAATIQGVLGAVELAPGYLKLVYDIVRKAGGVCIAEEMQTGFGRVGSHYWSFETQGVIPDIVTMGHGLPLGAVLTTPEIANVMARKIQLNTYGGNPVSSAGALAFLRVLDKEKRQKHCADVGSHLISRLRDLQQRHDIIGDVRGRGLIVGIEFVTDKKEKTPAKAETTVLVEKLRELGVLVAKGGLHRNVFVIRPPMCFTKEDADFLVDALDYSISNL